MGGTGSFGGVPGAAASWSGRGCAGPGAGSGSSGSGSGPGSGAGRGAWGSMGQGRVGDAGSGSEGSCGTLWVGGPVFSCVMAPPVDRQGIGGSAGQARLVVSSSLVVSGRTMRTWHAACGMRGALLADRARGQAGESFQPPAAHDQQLRTSRCPISAFTAPVSAAACSPCPPGGVAGRMAVLDRPPAGAVHSALRLLRPAIWGSPGSAAAACPAARWPGRGEPAGFQYAGGHPGHQRHVQEAVDRVEQCDGGLAASHARKRGRRERVRTRPR